MRLTVHRTIVLAVPLALALLAGPQRGLAQTPNIRVAGRVQAHFSTVSGDSTASFNPSGVVNSSWEIRRVRIQADVRIGENVNLVIQPSFEMGALRMRDAYLRVLLARSPSASLGLTMGQEKKPFNRYELTSSNNLLSIERGARFRGFTGVVAQNNLLEENGYIAHDLGASLDATLLESRLALKAGVYNGSGESANDVNDSKTFGLRGVWTALLDGEERPLLRVGAAILSRDRAVITATGCLANCTFYADSSHRTTAFGVEVEWGDFRPGLHIIADLATGDAVANGFRATAVGRNTGNLVANAPDSALVTFRSFHVVGAWRWQPEDPTGNRLIKMVEPALRLDYSDPNTDGPDDHGVLITPVLNLYFTQSTVLRAGLDYYRYTDATGAGRSVRAVRLSWQSSF
jgi:hypothetical protein